MGLEKGAIAELVKGTSFAEINGGVVTGAMRLERVKRGGKLTEAQAVRNVARTAEGFGEINVPSGKVVRVLVARPGEKTAVAVFNIKVDPRDEIPYIYSNLAGVEGGGAEGCYRTPMTEGIILGGASEEGLPDETMARLGLGKDKIHGGEVALQMVKGNLVVLDSTRTGWVKVEVVDSLVELNKKAFDLPVKFGSDLVPPKTFLAGGSPDWTLVASDDDKNLVKVVKVLADKSILEKWVPTNDFVAENRVTKSEIGERMSKRYVDNQDGTNGLKWVYGGQISGMALMWRVSYDAATGEDKLKWRKVPVRRFRELREKNGLQNQSEGIPNHNWGAQKVVDLKEAPENEGPIGGNYAWSEKARIVGDIHAGFEKNRPFGKMLDGLDKNELVVFAGDVTDRGKNPVAVMKSVKDMVMKGRAVLVMGNHEALMLAAVVVKDSDATLNWLCEGGVDVLKGLGVSFKDMDNFTQENMRNNLGLLRGIMKDRNVVNIIAGEKKLGALRDYCGFVRQYGKMHFNVNGVEVIHAGLPVNGEGNLIPMPKSVVFKELVGLDLLKRMEEVLRRGSDKELMALCYDGGKGEINPLWIRDDWIEAVGDKAKLSKIIRKINEQSMKNGGHGVEVVVNGHTPSMGGSKFGTIGGDPRSLFVDVGHYRDGKEAVLRLEVHDNDPSKVEVRYDDFTSGRSGVDYVAVLPVR